MRLRLLGLLTGFVIAAIPAPALAQTGGAAAPVGGGHSFEQPGRSEPTPAPPRLRAATFTVSPGSVVLGAPLTFTWRVDGSVRRVRARVDLVPARGGRTVRVALGTRRTGVRNVRIFTTRAGRVVAGRYVARLQASGARGAKLRRTARASGRRALEITAPARPPANPAPAPVVKPRSGIFPVQGPFTFGGADAVFGAGRSGHSHQGQDILAAEGTPVVTPVAGTVFWQAYQADGAGHYVVISGDDGRDYALMHFQDGSVRVRKGQRVAAGQRLASVGSTGSSSGPHVHFEIWPDGWYANARSRPIDPLPDLRAWAG
jgi:murein DD-endopeptidase MepM/ murein hydrolase activator NlpD